MIRAYIRSVFWLALYLGLVAGLFTVLPGSVSAFNIGQYSDTVSDSGPNQFANHTLKFTLKTPVSPGGVIEITPPADFYVTASSTQFAHRNIELYVNGVSRPSATSAAPGVDQVEITSGSPSFFRYTLAPDSGIPDDSEIEIRIGNHSSTALGPVTSFSTTTGTTTTAGDPEPIQNSPTLGTHEILVEIFDGSLVAKEDFVIFLVDKVSVPNADTTETVPPYRFNPAPTSTVGGTTLSVEISLETDELAICRYSTASGTPFTTMTDTFSNTGFLFHSNIVPVTPNSVNSFFVRCIDDEGNFNITDFEITFTVNDTPTGTSNTDGSTSGDGTGSGDSGSGTGDGGGGTSGSSDGEQPLEGGSSGSGGSGGGGGGGSGGDSGDESGGGFESTGAPYQSGDGRVIISGLAYPNSTVGILVDGNFFDDVRANAQGRYSVTLDEIARGVYTFGVFAEDDNDVRSSTFSTSFTVTGARTSSLGNINVPPSILVVPDPVDPGETLTVSGYGLPDSTITLENGVLNSNSTQEFTAVTDASGAWSTTIDTSGFRRDTYQIRAKSEQADGASTNFSDYTFYGVGQAADVPINADLNRDGSVNLIDFSILLFWWNSNGGDSDPPADINADGNVSLTDFSILLFNWTG